MTEPADQLNEIAAIARDMEGLGLQPVMVGGMALVMLGSRRVTRDVDFVISQPEERLKDLVYLFYDRGLELACQLDKHGDISATIDNRRVAAIRLKLDKPTSVYFLNHATGLRIDLLFDFPLAASELKARSQKTKIQSHVFYLAAVEDLIRMKEIAIKDRSKAGDAQDLEFLKGLKEET